MNLYNSWMVNQLIAHRGLHNKENPENTLAAFKRAIDGNYGVEIDVQMTLDGVLVVFHDDDLQRLTGLTGDIREVNYDYIKDAYILGTNEKIPTFEEFLSFIDGKIPILVEIKDHKKVGIPEQKIADLLSKYKGDFAVQSFNPFIVKWFKDNKPEFIRGQLASPLTDDPYPKWKKFVNRFMLLIKYNGSQFVSYDTDDIKRKQILRIKKRMPIIMWTVRDPKQLDETLGYYDNYMFENFIPKAK